jgi:hypothetical protein
MTEVTALHDIFLGSRTWAEGVTQEYAGWELRKVETEGLSPDHSEWAFYNPIGNKIESFTLNAFKDFSDFRQRLDEIIEYDPDTMKEWLNRNQ